MVCNVPPQLKELGKQQADWDRQRMELEQRVEDGEDKSQKLEKYVPMVGRTQRSASYQTLHPSSSVLTRIIELCNSGQVG